MSAQQMPPPAIGWARQLRTPKALPLCAVVARPPGWFLAPCGGRTDVLGAWEHFPKIEELSGDRLCAACAAYVLSNHRHELGPNFIRRLEVESGLGGVP